MVMTGTLRQRVCAEIERLCPGWQGRFLSRTHRYAAMRDGIAVIGDDAVEIAARVAALEDRC